MPKLSVEAIVGLLMEIVLAILDRLHVREPLVVWGLLVFGLALIADAVWRSDWASEPQVMGQRIKRPAKGLLLVFICFAPFGWYIFDAEGHDKTITTANTTEIPVAPTQPRDDELEAEVLRKLRNTKDANVESAAKPFQIIVGPMMLAASAKDTIFTLGYIPPNQADIRLSMKYANLAVYIGILNQRTVPTLLRMYSAEMQLAGKGNWEKLSRVDTVAESVYWHLQKLLFTSIDDSSFIDRQISDKALPPGKPITGWILFRYPQKLEVNAKDTEVRVRLTDANGNTAFADSDEESTQGGELFPGDSFRLNNEPSFY